MQIFDHQNVQSVPPRHPSCSCYSCRLMAPFLNKSLRYLATLCCSEMSSCECHCSEQHKLRCEEKSQCPVRGMASINSLSLTAVYCVCITSEYSAHQCSRCMVVGCVPTTPGRHHLLPVETAPTSSAALIMRSAERLFEITTTLLA